jgi:Uma2 family endonuclease
MATTQTQLLTAEDLLRLYSKGVRGELIRGELCETMPSGGKHGEVVVNMVIPMGSHIRSRRLGRLAASDSGVLLERDPDTVREPDIAYISAERLPLDVEVTGYYEVVPDLVVEVVSPGDSAREVMDKALMWLSYGTRLVWAVNPGSRTVDVYRPEERTVTLGVDDALDGLDILPGFTCPVSDIFDF